MPCVLNCAALRRAVNTGALLRLAVLNCAVLCRLVLSCAVLCRAMLNRPVPCRAVCNRAMLWRAVVSCTPTHTHTRTHTHTCTFSFSFLLLCLLPLFVVLACYLLLSSFNAAVSLYALSEITKSIFIAVKAYEQKMWREEDKQRTEDSAVRISFKRTLHQITQLERNLPLTQKQYLNERVA